MNNKNSRRDCLLGAPLALIIAGISANAVAADPNVSQPGGLNLGLTSFYDAFPAAGRGEVAYIGYLRYSQADAVKDRRGDNISAFVNPKINVATNVHQFLYNFESSPVENATLGLDLIIPLVSFDTSFSSRSPAKLTHNSGGLGDIFVGTYLQYDPVIKDGRAVFSQRFELGFNIPTGRYDAKKDINPGANHWSFNPTWSVSWLFAPKWSTTWRFQYLYNFKNTDPVAADFTSFKGQAVKDTQAGQALSANFALAYETFPRVHLGVSGYVLNQVENHKVNGKSLSGSKEKVIGVGPGIMWNYSNENKFTMNLYTETQVKNRSRNKAIANLVWLHKF